MYDAFLKISFLIIIILESNFTLKPTLIKLSNRSLRKSGCRSAMLTDDWYTIKLDINISKNYAGHKSRKMWQQL